MARTIPIQITGRTGEPVLPPLFAGTARAAGGADNEFLPASYLRPTGTFDVGAAARSADGAATHEHAAAADEIVVLELADGSTLITSAARLRDAIAARPSRLAG